MAENTQKGPLLLGALILLLAIGWWALQPDSSGEAGRANPSTRADGTRGAEPAEPGARTNLATVEVCLLDVGGAVQSEGRIAVHRQRGKMRSRGPGLREDVSEGCVTLELEAVQHRFERHDDPRVHTVVALAPGANHRVELRARREVCAVELFVDPFPEGGVVGGVSGARTSGARWLSRPTSDDPTAPIELRALPCGPVNLWAQDQGRKRAPGLWTGELTEPVTQVTVSLGDECTARYRAVDATTDAVITEARAGKAKADADGVIAVPGCASGMGTVTVSADGYRSRLVAILDPTLGQDEVVTVALEPGEGHVGRVQLDEEPEQAVAVGGEFGTASLGCTEGPDGTWRCAAAEHYPAWIWTDCGRGPRGGSAEARLTAPGEPFTLDCTVAEDTSIPPEEAARVRFQLTSDRSPPRGVVLAHHYPLTGRMESLAAVATLKVDETGLSDVLDTRAGAVRATVYGDPGNPGTTFEVPPGESTVEVPLSGGSTGTCRAVRAVSPPPYRLLAVEVGSGPWEAGLRPGDALVTVPGLDLSAADSATVIAALDPQVGESATATLRGADGEVYEATWTCEALPLRRPRSR